MSEEAERAIRALHNQYTLPGGVGPIQVRYADGERERLGAVEYKLFVGSLNKQATEKEVKEIFSPYGQVEDVYLMRDELKQSRGCGFVKFSHRDMAMAAINALNGIYTMRGCDQPLTVRFADPKRPRPGESRGAPAFGGPGFGPRFQAPGVRPTMNQGDPIGSGRIPPNAWRPMSPQNLGPSSNAGIHGFGNQSLPRSGDGSISSTPLVYDNAYLTENLIVWLDGTDNVISVTSDLGVPLGGLGGSADGSLSGIAVSSSATSQQSFNQPMLQVPSIGEQISPLQKSLQSPQHLPPSLQLQSQTPASYTQPQTPHSSLRQFGQLQISHSAGQTPFNQTLPSQQLLGLSGQLSGSQPQVQQSASSATAQQTPVNLNLQQHAVSVMANQHQVPAPSQQQLVQPLHQSPSQLAQLLSQQTQALQASFQSSQQAFSQLQQQLQLMQPSNQTLTSQQGSQTTKQQWPGTVPQTVASTATITPATDVPSTTSAVPVTTQAVAPVKCNWTEHTSPDGYKYYHNSVTGESRWEKPEELTLLEQQQQQQKSSVQQSQAQSHTQVLSTQQIPQAQQVQLQTQLQAHLQAQLQSQLRQHQQMQQPPVSSSYQASGVMGQQNVQVSFSPEDHIIFNGCFARLMCWRQGAWWLWWGWFMAPVVAVAVEVFKIVMSKMVVVLVMELGYAQAQVGASSVNDPARFQQGLQAAQEWMWKNKPAGSNHLLLTFHRKNNRFFTLYTQVPSYCLPLNPIVLRLLKWMKCDSEVAYCHKLLLWESAAEGMEAKTWTKARHAVTTALNFNAKRNVQ
ncbi:Flowering time control protein FCA [Vitis vinifera]|uniref:Flowering time control protein FCA n=1 Tax=Vitis vinifera TaxID=29760 RepID=A0A438GHC7_VITVI|nr:Flowering time control protein FCA [Vitis vinifera]